MKKLFLSLVSIFILMSLCSCQTNAKSFSKETYCYFCSKEQKPLSGYSVYDGEKLIALSNSQGFVRIPSEYAEKKLVAKKMDWETIYFTPQFFQDGTVLCISVKHFNDLCFEVASFIKEGDIESAQKIIEKMNGDTDLVRAFECALAYKSGDYEKAHLLLRGLSDESF